MRINPFVEREDNPDYLLVGTQEKGYTAYVHSMVIFNALMSAMDKTQIHKDIQQKIMDAFYGAGVADLSKLSKKE